MPGEKKSISFILLFGVAALMLGMLLLRGQTPDVYRLWQGDAPGAIGKEEADRPTIRAFLPPLYNNTRASVVICPGGAYKLIMRTYEGEAIANWFNSIGVAAFVLEYRISPRYRHPAPMEDVLRAIRYVRYNAKTFNVDPDLIGVMGFSAGGHLASTAATHYSEGIRDKSDPVDNVSARPDFAILGYSIVSLLNPVTHDESARNLLGDQDSEDMRRSLSNHLHVTDKTPPAFLFHTQEDIPVPAENSILYYQALTKANVPAELHIYEKGQHGAGIGDGLMGAHSAPNMMTWPDLLKTWMEGRGFLSRGAGHGS